MEPDLHERHEDVESRDGGGVRQGREGLCRRGTALRGITWSNQTDEKVKVASDTMRMEVSDLVKVAIDADVFKLLDGYEVRTSARP